MRSEDIIEEVYEFLIRDFHFQAPRKYNTAYESHVVYTKGNIEIDIYDDGDWSFPSIIIKKNSNYIYIPDFWFTAKELPNKIHKDFRGQRNLNWLKYIEIEKLEKLKLTMTKQILEINTDDYNTRGKKIIVIYLLLASNSLRANIENIPSLFKCHLIRRIKNYLQQRFCATRGFAFQKVIKLFGNFRYF
jgi:hypothetical protein